MPAVRLSFLDGLRGFALILMVVNHTSRDWLDRVIGWPRYHLIYGSVLFPAAIFLFLVGFCLPISYRRRGSGGSDASPSDDSVLAGAWKYTRRGAVIVGAGYLLNVAVIRDVPVWAGGVLQTIGLGIIVFGTMLPLMRFSWARWAVLAFGVLFYLAFVIADPTLVTWSVAHQVPAQIVFLGFPPWPWLSAAAIGLGLGWMWLDARERGPRDEVHYFWIVAVVGVVCVLAYFVWEILIPTEPMRFGFRRDFILNTNWTPRGMTTVLVVGGVALSLAAAYYVMEVKNVALPWLVVLGQTALMLYFVHQVIELTIVSRALGLRFTSWSLYWLANAVFVVVLVYLGKAWLEVKRLARTRGVPLTVLRRS